MKKFLDAEFLLETSAASELYHDYAEKQPIFDYHCHLQPKEIYENIRFENLAQAWLYADHYKWRLLREAGVDEKFITGDASDREKFQRYAEVLPYAIGNPVYHWTHLELQRFFGIYMPLNADSAQTIWDETVEILKSLSARKMIEQSGVTALITTDSPLDDLHYHRLLRQDENFGVRVLPAFRADKLVCPSSEEDFLRFVYALESLEGKKAETLETLFALVVRRMDAFEKAGCITADHALDTVDFCGFNEQKAATAYKNLKQKTSLTKREFNFLKSYFLVRLGKEYARRGWVQQYHIGALRNVTARSFARFGPDTGFDAIADAPCARRLACLLDTLDSMDCLPKTILYCLNPQNNETLAALKNCFSEKGIASKVQVGSAWWLNDHKSGMEQQLGVQANFALLSGFVGMLTDSRSFLSYPRHEYFRRILCNFAGRLIENGEYPKDLPFVGKIISNICYGNAINFFGLKKEQK